MADIDNLEATDVLDFDDDQLPELPDDNPFDGGGSKKPWLLAGIGVAAVTLAIVVVLKLTTGGRVETGLIELPIDRETETLAVPDNDFIKEADRIVAVDDKPVGMPERVVDKRKDVTFDPDKPSVQRPKPRPVAPGASQKPTSPKPKAQSGSVGWVVQVGSYNSRAAAEAGQKQLQSKHASLFSGQDFVILSAVLPNGKTTYRLRVVGFASGGEANSFCRNAESDGISCYVAK